MRCAISFQVRHLLQVPHPTDLIVFHALDSSIEDKDVAMVLALKDENVLRAGVKQKQASIKGRLFRECNKVRCLPALNRSAAQTHLELGLLGVQDPLDFECECLARPLLRDLLEVAVGIDFRMRQALRRHDVCSRSDSSGW